MLLNLFKSYRKFQEKEENGDRQNV